MTPLKETLEAANPAGEATSTQGSDRAKSDAGHLRSDAVSLDVPVKIHGSRVTEVVRGITPHTEPFEEQTATMIVFPQGGVVKMAAAVTVGQMVVLTNLKSGHDAICRVVKVRAYAKSQSYVELEFTNRQPGYWGVYFPSEKADAAPRPPVAPPAPDSEIEKVAHSAAPIVAPPPPAVQPPPAKPAGVSSARSTHTGKPESSFVGIGSQEDVQPAASATGGRKKDSFAAPVAPVSMAELRGDAHPASPVSLGAGVPGEEIDLSQPLSAPAEEEAPATFGRFAASSTLGGGHAPARQLFGAHFEAGSLSASASSAESSRPKSGANWILIAASIVIAFVLAAGGVFYFKVLPAGKAPTQSVPAVVPSLAPAVAPTASTMPIPNPPAPATAVNSPALASEPPVVARVTEAPPKPSPSRAPSVEPAQPKPAPSPKAATVVPDISSSLSAHPKASQRTRSADSDAAPSLDMKSSSAENNVLSGITAPSVAAPPPPQLAAEAAPVRIGGNIKPPRLISSVLPVYPAIARTARVEGRVVITTSVEKDGSITGAKVVSGPVMLRQAALDALRQWKYAPGTLNGQPVPVDITVTLEFHR